MQLTPILRKILKNASKKYITEKKELDWAKNFCKGQIPLNKIECSYTRSSGPGGQNVNKVSTKAEIRFNLREAKWLPEIIKENIFISEKNRINKKGECIITNEEFRTQTQNYQSCIDKLFLLIKDSVHILKEPSLEQQTKVKRLQASYKSKIKASKIIKSNNMKGKRVERPDFD